jgi:hypothetical protein
MKRVATPLHINNTGSIDSLLLAITGAQPKITNISLNSSPNSKTLQTLSNGEKHIPDK